MFWKSNNTKPTEPGIYVVAEFQGEKMVELNTNWARTEDYWGPNSAAYCGHIHVTHWIAYADYRRLLETQTRE